MDRLTSEGYKESHISVRLDSSRTQCRWEAGKCRESDEPFDGMCMKGVTGDAVTTPSLIYK